MKYAILDVGTNNVLFLIAEVQNGEIKTLYRSANISAMGKRMKDSCITNTALKRTKSILADNIKYAKIFTDNIIILGTSCSREAKNINELSSWLKSRFGLNYNIISGELEARLSGIANLHAFPEYRNAITFDVGGGSTEFNFIKEGNIISSQSLPLGIRRLDNAFGKNFDLKLNETKKILADLIVPQIPDFTLIGIGGTVTSLAAYKVHMQKYDGEKVHKSKLSETEIRLILDDFRSMTDDEIAYLIPFDRYRADILATGTMIVHEILKKFKMDDFVVSDFGMQYGILYQDEVFIKDLLG
jgi:exopolyphosphatase / guanosine-5'-triphosphate,3'-diphosphate pyrophosphatase